MKQVITLKQYELIYRIVSSLGKEFSHGSGRSCQFYNVNAAYILNNILRIKARPVMGAAFIRVNEEGDALSYAGKEGEDFYSSPDAFHCWVETEDYYLDFTAPEYKEAASTLSSRTTIERKMFQKKKSEMAESPFALVKSGDYYFAANPELTDHFLRQMASIPASADFAHISSEWYKRSAKKKGSDFQIMNDLGQATTLKLKKSSIESAW